MIRFIKTYSGRPESSHPYEQHDCSVRVLVETCGMQYDAAWELLARAGRMPNRAFNLGRWLGAGSIINDHVVERIYQPGPSHPTISLREMLAKHLIAGTLIVRIDGHLTSVIDGAIYDTHPLDGKTPVRIMWRVT